MTNAPEPKSILNDLKWVHVALVVVLCGTVFSLVRWGNQDLQTISTFIIAVAGVAGVFYLRQSSKDSQEIKTLANGNLLRKDQEINDLQNKLALIQRVHTQEVAQMAVQVPNTAHLPDSLLADTHANGSDSTAQLPVVRM